ncbi:MAG TPA: hypothetical protein VKA88_07925 [Solirubrobacterales bacterium]|nr:hypothetical protein [Solirubrobacterales bacterium]
MKLRVSAQQAGWTIREVAWDFEERVLWRGSDATQEKLDRVAQAIAPLQRLIQTRLTWPLSDAWRVRSRRSRMALAASASVLALAAAGGGAVISADQHGSPGAAVSAIARPTVTPANSDTVVLQGATPQFESGEAPIPAQPPAKPSAPPAKVAWRFSQAFVAYEVGRADKETAGVFGDTASKQLAKALADDPPRLPAKGKVPQARVLNVVLGTAAKSQLSASVSLVRLRAISELRLTLTKRGDDWRVAQVLG